MATQEPIQLYRVLNDMVNDAFDHIVLQLCLQKERFGRRTFYLCGVAPGVGTTTIAVELSISLALAGWRTLLLDCDLRKASTYKRLNEGATVGLADYIRGQAELSRIITPTNWQGLDYVPSGRVGTASPLQLLYSSRMRDLTGQLGEGYDFVLIDGPASSTAVDAEFLALQADGAILVAAMDGSRKRLLEDAKRRLEGLNANLIGVIENKVELGEYRQYEKNFDYFNRQRFLKKPAKG